MRTSNKTFPYKDYVVVNKKAAYEEIKQIRESKWDNVISLEIYYFSDDDTLLGTDSVEISGEYYELLMSESPEFAIGKPANEYREVDLWYMIDKIRNV